MKSDINPFEMQETKPYKNDPRISAMTDLVDAYQRDDIHGYEKILQNNKDLLADPFIEENIDEVTRNMRTKAVHKLIVPYTQFTLNFVAKQLNISLAEVQDILGYLIVDKQLRAKIDQQRGVVQVDRRSDVDRVDAVQEWSNAIGSFFTTSLNEDNIRSDEGTGMFLTPGSSSRASMTLLNGGVGRMRVGGGIGSKRMGGVLRA